jgi:phage terminase small subunit
MPKPTNGKLTPRQELFVREYLIDLNGTTAYRRAGYRGNDNACAVNASRLLRNDKVAKAIEAARAERTRRIEINQDTVLRELARIAFSQMTDYAFWDSSGLVLRDSSQLTEDQVAAISEIREKKTKDGTEITFKLYNKPQALESLGRHLGLFVDRLKVGPDTESYKELIAAMKELARGEVGKEDSGKEAVDAEYRRK